MIRFLHPTVWDFSAILPVLGYLLPEVGINGYDEAGNPGRFLGEEDTVVGEEVSITGGERMAASSRLEPGRRRGGERSRAGCRKRESHVRPLQRR